MQNILLSEQINNFSPSLNKYWLDIGCGNGKLIPNITKYNPKYYMGVDIDIKQLIKCLKYHDVNQEIYNFTPCDLKNNWSESLNKWVTFPNKNIKFDYIIANFSLMHFFNDEFWTQLNSIVYTNTKFLFNLVNINKDFNGWYEANSFLKMENNIVSYKFEWTHENIKTEPYIDQDIIIQYLHTFNWKLIKRTQPNTNYPLVNLYNWWLVEKI
jgi:SAM-dependent methyltransferase